MLDHGQTDLPVPIASNTDLRADLDRALAALRFYAARHGWEGATARAALAEIRTARTA
jgi:hypothetical protein